MNKNPKYNARNTADERLLKLYNAAGEVIDGFLHFYPLVTTLAQEIAFVFEFSS